VNHVAVNHLDARPSTLPAVVALDVGGTDIKAALLDERGVLATRTVPTLSGAGPDAAARALDAVLRTVAELASGRPRTHHLAGVGVVTPGVVDEVAGIVVTAENLGWRDVPVRELVADVAGVPVGFGHDVRAGGLAEARVGAGRGAGDHAFLAVGTGIAASLVLRGETYAGDGWAGEIGHGGSGVGELCACGGRGCVETYASAAGMARRYSALTGDTVAGAREVLERAQAGDRAAAEVWARGVDGLGELVAQLVRTLGLRTVVVGGGLVRAGDALLVPLREATRRHLTVHPVPELRAARLGSDAGMIGASLLAWRAAGRPTPPDVVLAA
jgi:glucokinase